MVFAVPLLVMAWTAVRMVRTRSEAMAWLLALQVGSFFLAMMMPFRRLVNVVRATDRETVDAALKQASWWKQVKFAFEMFFALLSMQHEEPLLSRLQSLGGESILFVREMAEAAGIIITQPPVVGLLVAVLTYRYLTRRPAA